MAAYLQLPNPNTKIIMFYLLQNDIVEQRSLSQKSRNAARPPLRSGKPRFLAIWGAALAYLSSTFLHFLCACCALTRHEMLFKTDPFVARDGNSCVTQNDALCLPFTSGGSGRSNRPQPFLRMRKAENHRDIAVAEL